MTAMPSSCQSAGLLVVTLDRLPAWMLSAWGATWVSTPVIDGLASRGVVCDRLIATSLDPHITLRRLAGTLAREGDQGPPRQGLLAAAAAAGRAPVLVTDDPELPALVAGDGVAVVIEPASVPRRSARKPDATSLARLFATAAATLSRGGHGVVWVHAGSLASCWDAPEEFRARYIDADDPPPPAGAAVPSLRIDADTDPDQVVGCRQVFAGQLTLLDSLFGSLLAVVPAGGWSIVLVGIRGMPLGLHGWVGLPDPPEAEMPYGESIHVPAVVVDGRGRMAGQRYPGLLTHADLAATLWECLGLQPLPAAADPAGDGHSLGDLFATWSHPQRDSVVTLAPGGTAVVTPAWQFVEEAPRDGAPPRGRLYAKPDDYFELSDVADRCRGVVAELEAVVASSRGEAPRRCDV